MKLRNLLILALSFALTFSFASCDDIKEIFGGNSTTETPEDPETPTDPETPEDPESPAVPGGLVKIESITEDGKYIVDATVVAVGVDAFIVADQTGAVMVYKPNHGRKVSEVVRVSGAVSRYNGYNTNVFQFVNPMVLAPGITSEWTYNPSVLDASAFDALVGQTANCIEIEFEGTLSIANGYVNVKMDGANKTASFKYINVADYNGFVGKKVVVRSYVVGTHNWLYMLPYSVEEKTDDAGGDEDDEPEDSTVAIGTITGDGTYTVKGTVVATGNQAYIVADQTGALMVYGYSHGRKIGDVITATGPVSRYKNYQNNALQMQNAQVEVMSTGALWSYNPTPVSDAELDAKINGRADTYEVVVEGWLSGNQLTVGDAENPAELSYVTSDVYSAYNGKYVIVKGYVVGTYQALKIIPYSIVVDENKEEKPIYIDNDPTDNKWMELPAMTDSSLDYYSHGFEMGGKAVRNYSFAWSQSDYIALWVAYPLCSMYTEKNTSRTDEWAFDPLLGELSTAPFEGYGKFVDTGDDPNDRGHHMPSADRLCSYEANIQTFYGTNITPQYATLNQGKIENLESKVRSVANSSDTLYVVTGCLLDGATRKCYDSNYNKMTYPVGYYKALLRLKNGNWDAAAFYYKHEAPSSSTASWSEAMTIDALETKVGVDFFVNLSDKIGTAQASAVEAYLPSSSWW